MTLGDLIWILDSFVCALLCLLALQSLLVKDLFWAIISYILFGLLLALVWVRFGAPDVALAEAAIGAGLTGALLLTTAASISQSPEDIQ
ncbi:Na(+)/H(+) antiporter subunit B [Pirellulaceae bacterium SH449]